MVQFRILNIRKQTIISSLEKDLNSISQHLRSDGNVTLEFPSAAELKIGLNRIYTLSTMLSKKDSARAKQLLRYLIFLLDKYEDRIVSSSSSRQDEMRLRNDMKHISKEIGVVPRLNCHVELPSSEFLPKNFTKTVGKWKGIPCLNPSRGARTIENGKITFLSRDDSGLSSVRAALKADADTVSGGNVISGANTYYLNLSDCEYYQLGQLHADHFLPSAQLIERLKEMVEMMNYDPGFRREMEESVYNDGYFISRGEQVIGNYWLYMAYHNSMQNLWFLLGSSNVGGGKVAADPIEWFEENSLGRSYLKYLADHGQFIDKSGVLYLVRPQNIELKESFSKWIENNNARFISFCRLFSRFHHDIRSRLGAVIDSKKRHRSVGEVDIILQSTQERIIHKDEDESSLSSADIGDREEVTTRTRKKLRTDPAYQGLLKDISKIERDTERLSRKEVSEEKKQQRQYTA
ncbi:MAG: hypothetical protein NXI01_10345 [Gammaproteobacteria bacterium]|nr:hypothetical protein [Gammaproteobacteria bacterium]